MGDSNFSIKKSFYVAEAEFIKWICNPKLLMFAMMFLFIYDYVIKEMVKVAVEMNTKLMVLEPFIAICNSSLLLLVMPSVYLSLMGDFPEVDANSMYYIQRVGKQNWMMGQFFFSVMTAVTFVFTMVGCSCLSIIGRSYGFNTWSDVVTKYVTFHPDKSQSLVANFITGRLYNNLKPIEAFWLSVGFMILYMILIAMLLMLWFTIGKRTAGIAVTCAVICIGSALAETGSDLKWIFPVSHTLSWMHYDSIYNFQYFDVRLSFLYFLILIVMIYVISGLFMERYDFSKISDMEE